MRHGLLSKQHRSRGCPCVAHPDGRATASLAGHEIGTGAYTTVALAVSQFLGIDVEHVTVQMGDSDLPPVMIAGGSNNAASATNVVAKACQEILSRIAAAAVAATDSPFHRADQATLKLADGQLRDSAGRSEPLSIAVGRTGSHVEVYAENVPEGLPKSAVADMRKGKPVMLSGAGRKDATAFAFGAHFVEVRVHRRTREVRVARVVSAFAAGTLINPRRRTANSWAERSGASRPRCSKQPSWIWRQPGMSTTISPTTSYP